MLKKTERTRRFRNRGRNLAVGIEGLEKREMLTGTVLQQGDKAVYVDDANQASRIIIYQTNNGPAVRDGGQVHDISWANQVEVRAGDRNDRISASGNLGFGVEIFGDGGNDYIAGTPHLDFLDGGDGNDLILGGNGDDIIYGGAGNDRISAGRGDDYADGEAGNDRIIGSGGDDWLVGGIGRDLIVGGNGDDWIVTNEHHEDEADDERDYVHCGWGEDFVNYSLVDGDRVNNRTCEATEIIVSPPASLGVWPTDIPTETHVVGDNDIEVFKLRYDVDRTSAIDIANQYFSVEVSLNGQLLPESALQLVEDVEMHNDLTGRTIDATVVATGPGYIIASVSDFVVRSFDDWTGRVDSLDIGQEYDVRTHNCTEAYGSTGTCDFGGLIPPTSQYNLEAYDLDTGEPITWVLPGGQVASNIQEVRIPEGRLVERTGPSVGTVVENERDYVAWRGQFYFSHTDGCVSSLTIGVEPGGEGRNIRSAAWWLDANGDNQITPGGGDIVIEDGVAFQGGDFDFDEPIGGCVVIPEGPGGVYSEVLVDISPSAFSAPDNTFQLTAVDFQSEVLADGRNVPSTITNTPQTPTTVVDGMAFVTTDITPIQSQNIPLGTTSQIVFAQDVLMTGEAGDLDYVGINFSGDSSSVQYVDIWLNSSLVGRAETTTARIGDDFGAEMHLIEEMPEDEISSLEYRVHLLRENEGGEGGETFAMLVDAIEVSGLTSSNRLTVDIEPHISAHHSTVDFSNVVARRDAVFTLLEMNGGVLLPVQEYYDDVTFNDPIVGHLSDAVQEGWIVDDCVTNGTSPCNFNPDQPTATFDLADWIVAGFGLQDQTHDLWLNPTLNTLANACVIEPTFNPNGYVTPQLYREMFAAVDLGLEWGTDCGPSGRTPDAQQQVEEAVDQLMALGWVV